MSGDLDRNAAHVLRDHLVDAAVRWDAPRVEVDLRGLGSADAHVIRALVDGYRAAAVPLLVISLFLALAIGSILIDQSHAVPIVAQKMWRARFGPASAGHSGPGYSHAASIRRRLGFDEPT